MIATIHVADLTRNAAIRPEQVYNLVGEVLWPGIAEGANTVRCVEVFLSERCASGLAAHIGRKANGIYPNSFFSAQLIGKLYRDAFECGFGNTDIPVGMKSDLGSSNIAQ